MAKWNADGLEIQTRSVEKVLVPLVAQVSILVNSGIRDGIDGNSKELLRNLLPNLELSICKFTTIGSEMGNSNSDIKDEMLDACDETNKACDIISSVLSVEGEGSYDNNRFIEAARLLLSAVTRILILADTTAVKKMVASTNKVDTRLSELENVTNFTEFVHAFSQFGGDMVELAYLSGERQNDLKNDLQRTEVCASRAILEKSTMMLLTTCKTCLRHPESPLAFGNRSAVFKSMRNAMKILKFIIEENNFPDSDISHGICLDFLELESNLKYLFKHLDDFNIADTLLEQLDNIAIDMDDVINVEQIDAKKKLAIKSGILNCKELEKSLRTHIVDGKVIQNNDDLFYVLKNIDEVTKDMMNQLVKAGAEQVLVVLSTPAYKTQLQKVKIAALSEEYRIVEEIGEELEKEIQTILEVSKLVKNVSSSESCIITASHIEVNLMNLLPQLIDAAKMLAAHPLSKITQENLEVFIDVWDTQVDELTSLLRNITHSEKKQCADWLTICIPMASKLSS